MRFSIYPVCRCINRPEIKLINRRCWTINLDGIEQFDFCVWLIYLLFLIPAEFFVRVSDIFSEYKTNDSVRHRMLRMKRSHAETMVRGTDCIEKLFNV